MDKNKKTNRNARTDNTQKNKKQEQLDQFRVDDSKESLTTNQGLKMSEDEFSLKAGNRGPTLMEDFHFREKITHFDHERIPERIVHARGFGAHGVFKAYGTAEPYTKAHFLSEGVETPVFVRFSTVNGFRGSNETVRDGRGFATKFYTEEGNYDLVGNNHPVFFIQDAIKFPDLVHSFKPEPKNEIPQATNAHDTFWDFHANNTETAHHAIWAMSPRGVPRSFRMMEGFAVHTFRFINAEGEATFVKIHWRPKLGVHGLEWEEAQMIAGNDPDFNRKDLYEAIEDGNYPEWELGIQVISEEYAENFEFDILDPTKIIPEEEIPLTMIGKMTLNQNTDNAFAETEQVAFHPGHVVPGIDFTNDPLLQGRLFSYTDTQLIRLGGPNFHELPINRPVNGPFNNQRDGYGRMTINTSNIAYHKNSLAANKPDSTPPEEGGYEHYQEKVEGRKVREESAGFKDHFSQPRMFYRSMSDREKQHIIDAYSFELGKCDMSIRQKNVDNVLANIDLEMAQAVAKNLGATPPTEGGNAYDKVSPALSEENYPHLAETRKVGILVDNGFEEMEVKRTIDKLADANVNFEVISETQGVVAGSGNMELGIDHMFDTTDSVLYDALYLVGGTDMSKTFKKEAKKFLQKTFDHYKAIAVSQYGLDIVENIGMTNQPGVITDKDTLASDFIDAIAKYRHWDREVEDF